MARGQTMAAGLAEGRAGPEADSLGEEGGARISRARILVVGSGGIGGTAAHEFGRLGVASVTVADFDSYCESNLNRQVACFRDSLGKPKAGVVAEDIRRMGLGTAVRAITGRRRADGFEEEIEGADFVVAAADDYAFSLALMDRALRAGKPCGAALPVGLWAAVAVFLPGGPPPRSFFGFPARRDEEGYAADIARSRPRIARHMRRRSGGICTDRLGAFAAGSAPPPQLCPVVWSAASILVLEAVKVLSGTGRAAVSPRYVELGADGPRIRLSPSALRARLPGAEARATPRKETIWRR